MPGILEYTCYGTCCSQLPAVAQMSWQHLITSQDCPLGSPPCCKHLGLLQWTMFEPITFLSPVYSQILATFLLSLLYDLKFTSQYGLDYIRRITNSARSSPNFQLLPLDLCIFFLTYCIINRCKSILKVLFSCRVVGKRLKVSSVCTLSLVLQIYAAAMYRYSE